jgi:mannose-6-phosphate isomerase-like protein (cupin superfamily)
MAESRTFPTTTRPLAVSLPEDRVNVCVGADTYSILVEGSQTEEKLAVIDMLIPPGGGPMPHAHECEETFLVLEGEVVIFCHDQRMLAKTGAAVNIPGWAHHQFANLTHAPARLLCIISGAGLERQFMEIGPRVATRTTPPPPVDPGKLAALMKSLPGIAAKYNARLLPSDTFDHLMTEGERELIRKANGE